MRRKECGKFLHHGLTNIHCFEPGRSFYFSTIKVARDGYYTTSQTVELAYCCIWSTNFNYKRYMLHSWIFKLFKVLTYYGVNEAFENAIRAALIARRAQRFWMTNLKKVQRPLLQVSISQKGKIEQNDINSFFFIFRHLLNLPHPSNQMFTYRQVRIRNICDIFGWAEHTPT